MSKAVHTHVYARFSLGQDDNSEGNSGLRCPWLNQSWTGRSNLGFEAACRCAYDSFYVCTKVNAFNRVFLLVKTFLNNIVLRPTATAPLSIFLTYKQQQ
jgi:hypothetical protein